MSYYVDRGHKVIQHAEWVKLRGDAEYVWVRRYENDRFRASVEWIGGPTQNVVPLEHAKPYRFTVANAIAHMAGSYTPSPIDSETFRLEHEAIACYENFLVTNNTGSEWLGVTDVRKYPLFVERGNRMRPPSKDEPTSVDEVMAEDAGSW